MLFEALTGALPHDGQTAYEIILNKQRQEPPRPRQLVDTVPLDLDELCMGLLQPNVRDRPQAGAILAAARDRLAGVLGGDEGAALRAAADAYASTEGVVASGRMFELQAPGIARR